MFCTNTAPPPLAAGTDFTTLGGMSLLPRSGLPSESTLTRYSRFSVPGGHLSDLIVMPMTALLASIGFVILTGDTNSPASNWNGFGGRLEAQAVIPTETMAIMITIQRIMRLV